jgi:hypothetical protein
MEPMSEEQIHAQDEQVGEVAEAQVPAAVGVRPADRIRAAIEESAARGAPMVSSQLVQAKLFSVSDDAAAVPEALALVQQHLRLTLDRTWYSAKEVEDLADQLDWLLRLPSLGSGEADSGTVGPDTADPDTDGAEPEAIATG